MYCLKNFATERTVRGVRVVSAARARLKARLVVIHLPADEGAHGQLAAEGPERRVVLHVSFRK